MTTDWKIRRKTDPGYYKLDGQIIQEVPDFDTVRSHKDC
jgi:hypothetical protein